MDEMTVHTGDKMHLGVSAALYLQDVPATHSTQIDSASDEKICISYEYGQECRSTRALWAHSDVYMWVGDSAL